ncbi:MAG TPA: DUF86 domain-containing protein [Alphaproteobacteria bacterium]|nr:DUF86 domain-containing protein [Alphaproteobacteria bacterium]HAJ46280.1 DUF86 domain-containing protein [Alphaproteobacteria bacterium]
MPKLADRLALVHIIDACQAIQNYVAGLDEQGFLVDARTRDAVTMQLLVIGEAANRLSDRAKAMAPGTPWDQVRALRNRIAHGYSSVNFSRVWRIATTDIPSLDTAARKLIENC